MMAYRRFLLEIGMGNDQYGQDYTKAAKRAISNAIRRSSIPFFETLQIDHKEIESYYRRSRSLKSQYRGTSFRYSKRNGQVPFSERRSEFKKP